jgi:hypothetical protein
MGVDADALDECFGSIRLLIRHLNDSPNSGRSPSPGNDRLF